MKTTVRKWGNSLAIRVPNDYVKTYHLSDGLEVEMLAKEAGIMIQTEMSLEEKNKISHRALAINKLVEFLSSEY